MKVPPLGIVVTAISAKHVSTKCASQNVAICPEKVLATALEIFALIKLSVMDMMRFVVEPVKTIGIF